MDVFYVGIGKPTRGKDFIRRSNAWHRYVQVNGTPVVWEVARDACVEDAVRMEKELIKHYGRLDIDENGVLVNRVTGIGAAGAVYSPERNLKVSIAKTGFRFSEEAKKKMSEAKKGRTLTEEHKRKIGDSIRGVKNGRYGKTMTEAQKEHLRVLNTGKKQSPETVQRRVETIKNLKYNKLWQSI